MSVNHILTAPRHQKRVLDSLEPQLQAVVGHKVGSVLTSGPSLQPSFPCKSQLLWRTQGGGTRCERRERHRARSPLSSGISKWLIWGWDTGRLNSFHWLHGAFGELGGKEDFIKYSKASSVCREETVRMSELMCSQSVLWGLIMFFIQILGLFKVKFHLPSPLRIQTQRTALLPSSGGAHL